MSEQTIATPTLTDPLILRACSWLPRRGDDGWRPGPSWPTETLPWLAGRRT